MTTNTRHATQNTRRLHQLRAAIDSALADPDDADAARTCGRLACTVGLLMLPEADDRRVLMLALLDRAASMEVIRKHLQQSETCNRPRPCR